MQKPFCSFIKYGKERKDRSVLLYRTVNNAKIVPFIYKEWKRTQRESKDRFVLLPNPDHNNMYERERVGRGGGATERTKHSGMKAGIRCTVYKWESWLS